MQELKIRGGHLGYRCRPARRPRGPGTIDFTVDIGTDFPGLSDNQPKLDELLRLIDVVCRALLVTAAAPLSLCRWYEVVEPVRAILRGRTISLELPDKDLEELERNHMWSNTSASCHVPNRMDPAMGFFFTLWAEHADFTVPGDDREIGFRWCQLAEHLVYGIVLLAMEPVNLDLCDGLARAISDVVNAFGAGDETMREVLLNSPGVPLH